MMPEEPEQSLRRAKRISPGVLLAVILLIVSTLLIYKIQSMESDRPHREALSRQTAGQKSISEPPSGKAKTPHDESGSSKEKPTPILDPITPDPELVLTQTANRQPLLPDVKMVEEGELNSTSWQNPFYNLFWKSKGWQFTEAGMVSTAGQISTATFVRPYKKISVSFRVDVKENLPSFELHLLTRDPANPQKVLIASAIIFQNNTLSVFAVKQGVSKSLKQVKLDLNTTGPSSVSIRFVGTGNRFVISVGGRRVLTCTQPALQSGRECFLSFLTTKDQVQISALRIEGE
ncbi:hypothetical protein [uncultured Gimesia sp.]|uniref:hypothetical protein n=1 Tax=uncultured Gimesia sp. TaxID=1678688 RepID=UPI00261F80F9|nr:hypothetical protein [uncultured Gimesia sp.]